MTNKDDSSLSSTSSYDESLVNSINFPDEGRSSYKTVLYEELRLIERNESEINVCWKGSQSSTHIWRMLKYLHTSVLHLWVTKIQSGAHMMLFFLSFVFGSMCTCCIHRLKYLFGNQCVLYPRILTQSTVHRMVYEFLSLKSEKLDFEPERPVEFVTSNWSENSVCYLPTYVPLVSGLAGLVWTTMFLMCSSGTTHNVTGAQRHWRALPIMFIFSAAMAGLCIYTSAFTQNGLKDLCSKLSQATGSEKCDFTVNAVTLAYGQRIRGVYQTALLSIITAWLHTICWLLSTLLILARVLLAVDFTLVHVTAHLVGNEEDILQKHEEQINLLNVENAKPYKSDIEEEDSEMELYTTTNTANDTNPQGLLSSGSRKMDLSQYSSVFSLVPEMEKILIRTFIRSYLYNLVNNIGKPESKSMPNIEAFTDSSKNVRFSDTLRIKKITEDFSLKLREKVTREFNEFAKQIDLNHIDSKHDTEVTPISKELDVGKEEKYQKNTTGLPKESGKNHKGSHVQFYDVSTSNRLTKKSIKENDKTTTQNEETKFDDKDKPSTSGQFGRFFDDLNDGALSAPENKITTEYQKQENNNEGVEPNKLEDNSTLHTSGEPRITEALRDENMLSRKNKITTNDQEKTEKTNIGHKSKHKEKPGTSGELRIFDNLKQENMSAPDIKMTTEDQEKMEKKDIGNVQHKSKNEEKSGKTGDLRIFDNLKQENMSAPDDKITIEDQDKTEQKDIGNVQHKSKDKEKPNTSGELRIFDNLQQENMSAPDNKIATKDQKKDDENKQDKSEGEIKEDDNVSAQANDIKTGDQDQNQKKDEKNQSKEKDQLRKDDD